jgi:DNA-binding transcriptional MerR regulator
MHTIRQVAEITGFSPDTLRYYEKIGLLKSPQRGPGGVRTYSDDNVHLLTSLNCLKKTGLSLEDIKEFVQEGKVFENRSTKLDVNDPILLSRIKVLSEHLNKMEEQRRELDDIIKRTKKKLDYFNEILNENTKLEEVEEISK